MSPYQLRGSVTAVLAVALLSSCQREAREVPPVPVAPPVAPCVPRCFVLADSAPSQPADLDAIRARGKLRVLVHRVSAEALPRAGSAAAADAEAIGSIADQLGVGLELVGVAEGTGLLPALLAGKGDMVGDALVVDGKAAVTFSAALRAVDLEVVARKGQPLPRKSEEVVKYKPWIARAVATATPVDALLAAAKIKAEAAPERNDAEEVLAHVASGEAPLAITRADDLATYQAYGEELAVGAVLAQNLPVAWAVAPVAPGLLAAVNAFLYERALTSHRDERYVGDLAEILKRRVLRVAMLNNPASYFVYRGQQVGFQYDLASMLAARLQVRLEPVVPARPGDVWKLLEEKRVDIVPVTLTADTQVPASAVVSHPLDFADQLIVQPAREPAITDAAQLAGRKVYARLSSAYMPALRALQVKVPTLEIVAAPEESDTEELIDKVGKGELPLTVANSALLNMELTYRDDVQGSLVVSPHQPLVWASRADAPALAKRLQEFVDKVVGSASYNELYARYFKNKKRMSEVLAAASGASGSLSPYDPLAKTFGTRFGIDWRLVIAQMYQESRFDPRAVSWMGAQGLMQVMPFTGKELGFKDLFDPEQNVNAGVKYLSQMIKAFDTRIPLQQRVRFGLAAYNAGYGHVVDARILAIEKGLDPNRWFKNVELTMPLLEKPEFYRRARRGYVRGREPVTYVSQIQTKYDAYTSVVGAADVP